MYYETLDDWYQSEKESVISEIQSYEDIYKAYEFMDYLYSKIKDNNDCMNRFDKTIREYIGERKYAGLMKAFAKATFEDTLDILRKAERGN